jgi:hypothetical protein
MRRKRLREMTDHELTVEWLDEVSRLIAETDPDGFQYLETSLRCTRELNRRARASKSVNGWCACAVCFHWTVGEEHPLVVKERLGEPRLFDDGCGTGSSFS